MNIFGKAKQLTTRESFFTDRVQSRKYAEDQLAEMKSYILGYEFFSIGLCFVGHNAAKIADFLL